MRGKIAKQYRNYGELLYAEGLTKRQNHIKAVRERAEQVESRELAEVTLMPKIRFVRSVSPCGVKDLGVLAPPFGLALTSFFGPLRILDKASRTKKAVSFFAD
jgi:hypothetical protein